MRMDGRIMSHLVSEQRWIRLEGRRRGLVDRVVLRRLDKHELEREHHGVDAEHRPPVLGEDGQRHEPGVEVDVRVPRSGGACHCRSCKENDQDKERTQHSSNGSGGGGGGVVRPLLGYQRQREKVICWDK